MPFLPGVLCSCSLRFGFVASRVTRDLALSPCAFGLVTLSVCCMCSSMFRAAAAVLWFVDAGAVVGAKAGVVLTRRSVESILECISIGTTPRADSVACLPRALSESASPCVTFNTPLDL